MKNKIVGVNYLERHTKTEDVLGLNKDHVIVDREDWQEVVRYFMDNPEAVEKQCCHYQDNWIKLVCFHHQKYSHPVK